MVIYSPSGATIDGTEDSWPPGYTVAVAEDTLTGCDDGKLSLEPAEADDGTPMITVSILADNPTAALSDTDCDGKLLEWRNLCPDAPDLTGRDKFCDPSYVVP